MHAGGAPQRRTDRRALSVVNSLGLPLGLSGLPGDSATGQILGRPSGLAQEVGRLGGSTADLAGHHDGGALWQFVDAIL